MVSFYTPWKQKNIWLILYRCSRSEVFFKKIVLKNFAKFTRKHFCQSLFFNKDAALRPVTLLKERLWYRRFSVNFVKFLRTFFLWNTTGGCFRLYLCWTRYSHCSIVRDLLNVVKVILKNSSNEVIMSLRLFVPC